MTRYFATNSLAGATKVSAAVTEATTAGRFNASFAQSAIAVLNGLSGGGDYFSLVGPFLNGASTISGFFSFRFDIWSTFIGSDNTEMWKWMNGSTNAYRIKQTSSGGVCQFQYWNGSTWVNWGSTFSYTSQILTTFVVNLTPQVSYEIYQNGALVASSSTAVPSAQLQFTEIRGGNTNTTGTTFYSQIMGADYDLRGANYKSIQLSATSAVNTGGSGAHTDINETVLNDATLATLTVAGTRRSWTKSALAPGSLYIKGLVINARGRNDASIADDKLMVRVSGTNYDSGNKAFPVGFAQRMNIWDTNPATAAAWSEAAFDSAEVGIAA